MVVNKDSERFDFFFCLRWMMRPHGGCKLSNICVYLLLSLLFFEFTTAGSGTLKCRATRTTIHHQVDTVLDGMAPLKFLILHIRKKGSHHSDPARTLCVHVRERQLLNHFQDFARTIGPNFKRFFSPNNFSAASIATNKNLNVFLIFETFQFFLFIVFSLVNLAAILWNSTLRATPWVPLTTLYFVRFPIWCLRVAKTSPFCCVLLW